MHPVTTHTHIKYKLGKQEKKQRKEKVYSNPVPMKLKGTAWIADNIK